MKTQVVLAAYETSSFFVFPARTATPPETAGVGAMLPTIFDWEPHPAPGAAGHYHVHIFLEPEAPPAPGSLDEWLVEEPANNPVIAGHSPAQTE